MQQRNIWKHISLALAVALVITGVGSWAFMATAKSKQFWHRRPATQAAPAIKAYDFSPLVEKVQGAVFNLSITSAPSSDEESPMSRRRRYRGFPFPFFDRDRRSPFGRRPNRRQFRRPLLRSAGTGFLISEDGYALTNHHVIRSGGKITAQLADKREFPVKVIGKAPFLDIALIKLQAKGSTKFPYVYLGRSDKIKVGAPVIAIGNAKGLGLTVTAGIVSARGRVIGSGNYDNYIQTDAAINRGNSGGPLFNKNGEVVGINTAILRNGRGIGFAIPINIAVQVLPQLRTKGKVERAQLGVFVQRIDGNLARSFGMDRPRGALVARVMPRSPAQRAGLKAGDVILKVDNTQVRDHNHLPVLVAFLTPGQKLKLTVLRNRKKKVINVTLRKWGSVGEDNEDSSEDSEGPTTQSSSQALRKMGMSVTAITESIQDAYKLKNRKGVVVKSLKVDGIAAVNGVREGDVILEVNQTQVKSLSHFKTLMGKVKSGDHVLLRIRRKNNALFVAFPAP
ncbi:MAG: Do family serine endopeptidase [Deltaproteobacteria bacterium]|nr:MAG: Do family serine endopeptidase [Deltaproteobacteria bacterium]